MTTVDTYQWRMRALGAFLDTHAANDVTVIETQSGFAVRYYQGHDSGDTLFVLVEAAQIRAITEALKGRRRTAFDDAPTSRAPGQVHDRYQDLFRALGWELDDLRARNVMLDEREDGFYVSYLFRDPATGRIKRKRIANLGPVEREAILADAKRRRRQLH
jgi:uncharacterized protein YceH (UPF0502 family)